MYCHGILKGSAVFLFLALAIGGRAQVQIKHYKTAYGSCDQDGKMFICLRSFEKDGINSLLVVNTETLETRVERAGSVKMKGASFESLRREFAQKPYFRALSAAESREQQLSNAGIIKGFPKEKGICLTIDLCPSHKSLDPHLFTTLITALSRTEPAVPLALSITGRFMLKHSADISWLEALERSGKIKITWVNHTFNHHYSPGVPLNKNFMLAPGTDISSEILKNEQLLLEKDLLPSCFFRFPGLISDKQILEL